LKPQNIVLDIVLVRFIARIWRVGGRVVRVVIVVQGGWRGGGILGRNEGVGRVGIVRVVEIRVGGGCG
jgi:hypothetical protein